MKTEIELEDLDDLIFSLAWMDCSCHHAENVRETLKKWFPDHDFKPTLKRFIECKNMPPGEGNPR